MIRNAETSSALSVGILLYPGFTLLDVAGPQFAFGMKGRTDLFWKTLEPVASDSGPKLLPTTTFAEFLAPLDVLIVPGGYGIDDAMHDHDVVEFLTQTFSKALYVAAVCSGSLLLGRAGLLVGRRATTHWIYHEMLRPLGAIPVQEKIVVDGYLLTGAGGTAGIELGLRILAEMQGDYAAQVMELAMEYDPEPPFKTGHPRKASIEQIAAARGMAAEILFGRSWGNHTD